MSTEKKTTFHNISKRLNANYYTVLQLLHKHYSGDESAVNNRVSSLGRQKRLAEWKANQIKNAFGELNEISGQDYVQEVNKAGAGIWVVLHLYKPG